MYKDSENLFSSITETHLNIDNMYYFDWKVCRMDITNCKYKELICLLYVIEILKKKDFLQWNIRYICIMFM